MKRELLEDQKWLYQKYVVEDMGSEPLAELIGCNPRTVISRIRKFGIPIRRQGMRSPAAKHLGSRAWLYGEYIVKQRSMKDLKESLRCSHGTLRKWLLYHGIEIRPPYKAIRPARPGLGKFGPLSSQWKGGLARCIDCGKKLSHRRHGAGARCQSCYNLWHRGKNHKDWIPPEQRADDESVSARCSIFYKEWRTSVFERDDYTCQKCLGRSKAGARLRLHPHHIENFATVKSKRYDTGNGITLCEGCHKAFHGKYGMKGNGQIQVKEFLAA